jgi:hypothetical protein
MADRARHEGDNERAEVGFDAAKGALAAIVDHCRRHGGF